MSRTLIDVPACYDAGRYLYRSWSKAPTQTTASGIWFDLSMSPGNPAAQYYFATPMVSVAMARSTDGGIDHGQSVGGSWKKFLHRIDIQTVTSTAAVSTFELCDYLLYYPGIAMDTGPVSMTNSTPLPRYADGDGVQIMVVEQNPYVGGAQFFVTYTNQDGVGGRVTPTLRCNTQVSAGTIATSATATSGCCGRYAALQRGDSGVRSIESIEFLTSDVGLLCLVLVRPLATVGIYEATAPNQFDMQRDFAYMPRIYDDAYLNLIAMPTGTLASAQIVGSLTTIWSAA